MKFQISALLFVATLLPGLSVAAPEAKSKDRTFVVRWAIAHEPGNIRLEKALAELVKNLHEQSNGALKLELVNYPEIEDDLFDRARDQLVSGEIEMSQIGTDNLEKFAPSLGALQMPGIFTTNEQVAKVVDGKVGDKLRGEVLSGSKQQVRALAFTYSGGFRHMLTRGPISDTSQFSFRKPPRVETADLLEKLGVKFVDCDCVSKGAMAKAFLSGKVSGYSSHMNRLASVINVLPEAERKKMVVTETGHSVFLTTIVVNEKFYQSLPANLQRVLTENVQKTAIWERKISVEQAEQNRQALLGAGIKVEAPTKAVRAQLAKASAAVIAKHKKAYGSIVKQIESTGKPVLSRR